MLFTTCGKQIHIDPADLLWAAGFSWNLDGKGYPRTSVKGKTVYLHVEIAKKMGISGQVDHEDRDKLNAHRSNLRAATGSQNQANRDILPNNKTGFIGVSFSVSLQKYVAFIAVNSRNEYLGSFDSAEEAARARDRRAIELHGEFAILNFREEL